MNLFKSREVREALQFAEDGGQALHIYNSLKLPNLKGGARCFLRYKQWAHLFDQNEKRLRKTAKRLGVNTVRMHRKGQRGQHVDLCGRPLERARAEC